MMITITVTSRCIQSVTIKSLAGQDNCFIVLRLLVTHHLMLTYAIHTTLRIIKWFTWKLFPDVISRSSLLSSVVFVQTCSVVPLWDSAAILMFQLEQRYIPPQPRNTVHLRPSAALPHMKNETRGANRAAHERWDQQLAHVSIQIEMSL